MTADQIILLLDLKASQERGAASMSCNQRMMVADGLWSQGLIDRVGFGSSFYRINQKGLVTLKKTGRRPSKNEVMEIEQALRKVNQRLTELKETSERLNRIRGGMTC